MLDVLIESKARRQRRAGGAVLSVAMHIVIIGAATAATLHGTAPTTKERVVFIPITPPPPATAPVHARPLVTADRTPRLSASPHRIVIDVPTIVPTSLPKVDFTRGTFDPADVVIRIGRDRKPGGGILDGDARTDQPTEWRGSEVLMHIVGSAVPRYPESLRQMGIEGRVLVRFTVDTLGRVDMASVQMLSSSHELFARAVSEALARFRFKPTEVDGQRARALAEMPFEFRITR